ncbi:MAG: exodeoxyribonuclease III [Christensenellaceae bacterium]
MKIISWNVNGLRAAMSKNFMEFFREANADVFCVQETKMQKEQADFVIDGYEEYWNSAEKKGYSGTAIFSRIKPVAATYDFGIEEHIGEGRVITLEFEKYFLVNVYTPNSQEGLKRLAYRMRWEDDFRIYLMSLAQKKEVLVCGDFNVAHTEMDIKNAKSNAKNAGFTIEERKKLTELLDAGFVDTFRELHPDEVKYTWWSYRFSARTNNAGWRIDYFLATHGIPIKAAEIYTEVLGSDHCPIGLEL